MSSHLKKKLTDLHVGDKVKETASALVSDVKEIASDTHEVAADAIHHVGKKTKEVLRKVEKKL